MSPEQKYVVGVDLGGTNLRLGLANRDGAVVARWSCPTVGIRDPKLVVDLIRDGVDHLGRQASVPRRDIHSIGVGAPGITNVEAGVVIATSYLMGWRDVPLRDLLEAALGIPASVDNDVNVAAIGESWVGAAKGTRDFVFLAIGTGIGAGIVLDGRCFRGAGWTAGEVGYMLLPGTPDVPAGRGQPGQVEEMLGGNGVKSQWQLIWKGDATTLPKDLTATEIFDQALFGDSLAIGILRRCAHILAQLIYNIALVLNCPLFVLGGGVGMHSGLRDETQRLLDQWGTRVQPRLALSSLGTDAQLMGAIRLALDIGQSQTAHPD